MPKKVIYIFILVFFVFSCESMQSVKRGITGEKKKSTDEFFIEKKDPLILPPDYESLPTPEDRNAAFEDVSSIEKTLGVSIEDSSSQSGSVESSILEKIRSK
tara:strand:+ start:139 stop:444 length:306 start_codon:yes stop_codon:yes gene_type:complete